MAPKENDHIYDKMLKAHWSKRSKKWFNFPDRLKYSQDLVAGQSLPEIYKLIKLVVKKSNGGDGFGPKAFLDTSNEFFWSNSFR